jgi:hypothetical protein
VGLLLQVGLEQLQLEADAARFAAQQKFGVGKCQAAGVVQLIRLDLFSPEAANELVNHLPGATLPPAALAVEAQDGAHRSYLAWVAVSGVLVVLTLIAVLLVRHRAF